MYGEEVMLSQLQSLCKVLSRTGMLVSLELCGKDVLIVVCNLHKSCGKQSQQHLTTVDMYVRSNVFILFPGRSGSLNCTVWDPNPPAGMKPHPSLHIHWMTCQLFCLFNSLSPSLCCRLRASGLGPNSLHLGSALSAPYSGACVQTEAERPVKQTYVLLTCTNTHTHADTHCFPYPQYGSNITLSHQDSHSVWSDTCFLSVCWINCTRTVGSTFTLCVQCSAAFSIHSQQPISCFLCPRCTRAGENGQVSFPTVCQRVDQLQNTAALQYNAAVQSTLLKQQFSA